MADPTTNRDRVQSASVTAADHLYIHVPFCGRRCSYCDFSSAVRREVPVTQFIDAIMAELVTRRVQLAKESLRSIYLGGGTPSKLGGDGVGELLRRIAHQQELGDLSTTAWADVEVTIEANPEDVTPLAASAWRAAGVNRVSLGVQSFDPVVLDWMHRGHGPDAAAQAIRELRSVGIHDVSVDLIFAVPDALGRDWDRDLDLALALDPSHISLYGLTIEPRTPLGRWTAQGAVREAPEDRYADEFLAAHHRLTGAGFEHYEVSNYARPGFRARHNSAYWSGAPYIGVGPAAHGFDGEVRRWNIEAYAEWASGLVGGAAGSKSPVDPIAGSERIGPTERLAEEVYLGLRTQDGLSVHQNELTAVILWIEAGWATLGGANVPPDRLRLTPTGWLRLDALAAALTAIRSRSLS